MTETVRATVPIKLKAKDGAKGDTGAKGDKGDTGAKGEDGLTWRTSEWKSGVTYHNDEAMTADQCETAYGTRQRFKDVVVFPDEGHTKAKSVYQCIKTHTAQEPTTTQKTVTALTAEFYKSTSSSTPTGGSWSTTQPTWSGSGSSMSKYVNGVTPYMKMDDGSWVTKGNTSTSSDTGGAISYRFLLAWSNGARNYAPSSDGVAFNGGAKPLNFVNAYYMVCAEGVSPTTSTSGWSTTVPTQTVAKPNLWAYLTYTTGSTTTELNSAPALIATAVTTNATAYYLWARIKGTVKTTTGSTVTTATETLVSQYVVSGGPSLTSKYVLFMLVQASSTAPSYSNSNWSTIMKSPTEGNPYLFAKLSIAAGDSGSVKSVYTYTKTDTSSSSNKPGSSSSWQTYWKQINGMDPIYTPFILADAADISQLTVGGVVMKDDAGEVVFEAKDGNVTCKTGTFENIDISGDSTFSGRLYAEAVLEGDNPHSVSVTLPIVPDGHSYRFIATAYLMTGQNNFYCVAQEDVIILYYDRSGGYVKTHSLAKGSSYAMVASSNPLGLCVYEFIYCGHYYGSTTPIWRIINIDGIKA